MFGLLKPPEDTSCRERSTHQQFYCGLCQSMGSNVGLAWRALHSYDAIFVALVADAVVEEAAEPSTTRCPMMPVAHKRSRAPSSVAMRYAAAVQVLLGDQWIADKAVEGTRWARVARPVLKGPVGKAGALLGDLGIDLSELEGFEHRQHAVEVAHPTLREAAAPTAEALALVFSRIAELPGASADPIALGALGSAVGQLIYVVDAVEDAASDARDGSFNPLVTALRVDRQRLDDAEAMIERTVRRLDRTRAELPLARHESVIDGILDRLVERARAAVPEARASLVPAPWSPAGLGWRVAAVFVALWTLALVMPRMAFAASPLGRLSPQANECKDCGRGCRDCGGDCGECGDACGDCGDACNGCGKDCGKPCNDCGRACDDCGKGCSDCGRACDDCGSACDNCNGCGMIFG